MQPRLCHAPCCKTQGRGPTPSLIPPVRHPEGEGLGAAGRCPGRGAGTAREGGQGGGELCRSQVPESHTLPRGKRSPRRRVQSEVAGVTATRPLRAVVSGGRGQAGHHGWPSTASRSPRPSPGRQGLAWPEAAHGHALHASPAALGHLWPPPSAHISDNHGAAGGGPRWVSSNKTATCTSSACGPELAWAPGTGDPRVSPRRPPLPH